MKKLSFEIKTGPLRYHNVQDENEIDESFKVIIRDDTSEVLSVMKKSYSELKNREFEKIAETLVSLSSFELVDFTEFKGGRIVLATLKDTKGDIILFGKKIENYLILGSSHDGSYPLFVGTMMYNLFCENQLSKIDRLTKIKHTSTFSKKREDLQGILDTYFKRREVIYSDIKKFQLTKVSEVLVKETLARVLDIKREDLLAGKVKTRKLNQLNLLVAAYDIEAVEYGHTLYAILNGVTRYTTHILKSKDKVIGNWHGVPNWINEKAYSIALELVETFKS